MIRTALSGNFGSESSVKTMKCRLKKLDATMARPSWSENNASVMLDGAYRNSNPSAASAFLSSHPIASHRKGAIGTPNGLWNVSTLPQSSGSNPSTLS